MSTSKTFNILSQGGLGDALLTTPVFRALKAKYPQSKIKVYCIDHNHTEIYRNNPHIDVLKKVGWWTLLPEKILSKVGQGKFAGHLKNNRYGRLSPSKYYSKHARLIIADLIDAQLPCGNLEVYLTAQEEALARTTMAGYKNPVIIHVTSLTSANQHWPVAYWELLIKQLPEFTFVQLGEATEVGIKGTVDLRGKTTVRESMALLKYASSFVGVVSFLAHATAAVGLPGVVLYGPSTPLIWGHQNNINLYLGLRCAPCIDILYRSPCPYACECMAGIMVDDVSEALKKQLT